MVAGFIAPVMEALVVDLTQCSSTAFETGDLSHFDCSQQVS
jgi:hypothetical protein